MDNASEGSDKWTKVKKKNQKKPTSRGKIDVASPSTSGTAKHKANNTGAIFGKSGTTSIKIKQQIPFASNYRSDVSVHASGESNYGKNFEKPGTANANGEQEANHPFEELFGEIREILECIKLLDKICADAKHQWDLVVDYTKGIINDLKKVDESVKSEEIALAQKLRNVKIQAKENRQSSGESNDKNEIIHKFLRGEQQLKDQSLSISILWGQIGYENALTCKNILLVIATDLDYLKPDDGKKDCAEVKKRTDQIFKLIKGFEMSFGNVKEAFENMDTSFANNDEATYPPLPGSKPSRKELQASIHTQKVKQQDLTYQKQIQIRKELKQKVGDINASIKEIISKVETTARKLISISRKVAPEAEAKC